MVRRDDQERRGAGALEPGGAARSTAGDRDPHDGVDRFQPVDAKQLVDGGGNVSGLCGAVEMQRPAPGLEAFQVAIEAERYATIRPDRLEHPVAVQHGPVIDRYPGLVAGHQLPVEEHQLAGHDRRPLASSASNIASPLSSVSWYSACGSLSATMPPPTCAYPQPSRMIMVRIATFSSWVPLKPR